MYHLFGYRVITPNLLVSGPRWPYVFSESIGSKTMISFAHYFHNKECVIEIIEVLAIKSSFTRLLRKSILSLIGISFVTFITPLTIIQQSFDSFTPRYYSEFCLRLALVSRNFVYVFYLDVLTINLVLKINFTFRHCFD